MTVANCSKATDEARYTADIIYTLLSEIPPSLRNLREELISFAHQATNNCPYFTAAGFFEINYQLLLGFAATITSYVIIILQINK